MVSRPPVVQRSVGPLNLDGLAACRISIATASDGLVARSGRGPRTWGDRTGICARIWIGSLSQMADLEVSDGRRWSFVSVA
jgi:hypothetical protein